MPELTENEVIEYLEIWLKNNGWTITKTSKNQSHGIDILAQKELETLIIEAKGSKGSPDSPTTKRKQFSPGQLNTHLGVALVKILKEKHLHPTAKIAIAHPDDEYIRNCLKDVINEIKKFNVIFFWVKSSEDVTQE